MALHRSEKRVSCRACLISKLRQILDAGRLCDARSHLWVTWAQTLTVLTISAISLSKSPVLIPTAALPGRRSAEEP
jgi:hypothetical protein